MCAYQSNTNTMDETQVTPTPSTEEETTPVVPAEEVAPEAVEGEVVEAEEEISSEETPA